MVLTFSYSQFFLPPFTDYPIDELVFFHILTLARDFVYVLRRKVAYVIPRGAIYFPFKFYKKSAQRLSRYNVTDMPKYLCQSYSCFYNIRLERKTTADDFEKSLIDLYLIKNLLTPNNQLLQNLFKIKKATLKWSSISSLFTRLHIQLAGACAWSDAHLTAARLTRAVINCIIDRLSFRDN